MVNVRGSVDKRRYRGQAKDAETRRTAVVVPTVGWLRGRLGPKGYVVRLGRSELAPRRCGTTGEETQPQPPLDFLYETW